MFTLFVLYKSEIYKLNKYNNIYKCALMCINVMLTNDNLKNIIYNTHNI